MDTLYVVASYLTFAADPTPAKEDIKAGWLAFGIFLALAVATGLLCWSMVRHMRTAKLNAETGAFGDVTDEQPDGA